MKHLLFYGVALTAGLLAFQSTGSAQELVVFSGRKEALIKPVIELFEKNSGVRVVLKTGDSAALGQQILQEMPSPSADVFIAKESGSLEYLRLQNAFQPYTSQATARIPANQKARDGSWIGVSGRSRAVIFNKALIERADVPQTLEELLKPEYKGKIAAVNAGNESFVAWVSALRIYYQDDEKVRDILAGLKNNGINLLSKSHTDVRKAVGRGEYPLGLINHYYYHLQKNETDQSMANVGVVYLDQQEGQRGEILNVSGAAIVRGAKNLKPAQQFIDFLTSNEAQKLFARVNFEFPLTSTVPAHEQVSASLNCSEKPALECLRQMDVGLDELGDKLETTTQLLDEIDWY